MKRLSLTGLIVCLTLAQATAANDGVQVLRDRVYVERESGPLAMDVYLPAGAGPFPAVLVVHGGAWTMGSRGQLGFAAMAFAQHGYTAAAVSYRLAPKDKFPAQIYDCQAAVRWLRSHAAEFKLDRERIGGYGYSAGGHLVALLGALGQDDVREPGIVAEAPSARLQAVMAGGAPCDFRILPLDNERLSYWLGGTRNEKPDAYNDASPAAFVSPDDPPMFFFHGTDDMLVPVQSPRRMVELLKQAHVPAEIHEVASAGHIQTVFDKESLDLAIAFADRHLKGAAGGDAPSRSAHTIPLSPRAGPSSAPAKAGASDGQ